MGLKDNLQKKGLEMLGDPRVAKMMQDERVMKAMMAAMQVSGKVSSFTTEQTDRFAKTFRLGTAQEVKELQRAIKNLEAEVARLRKKVDG